MRFRRKLIFVGLIAIAGYTALCFCRIPNLKARRTLETLRGMVETQDDSETPVETLSDTAIEVAFAVAAINMTDSTAGLFADQARSNGSCVVGRVRTRDQFLDALKSVNVLTRGEMPVLRTKSGVWVWFGQGGAMRTPTVPPTPPPPTFGYQNISTRLKATPTLLAQNWISLEVDCELTKMVDKHPNVLAASFNAHGKVKSGDALIISGLTHQRSEIRELKLPGLSELPTIGSWFRHTYEGDIQEELLVLVMPRVVDTPLMK